MNYAELMQLYFERSNALQWYWTLYVVVVGGLLAFSSLRVRRDMVTGVLVSVLFCFFAYKNLDAIHEVTVQRFAALHAIQQYSSGGAASQPLLEATLLPPDYEGVRNFHVASDVLTVLALWAMELRRIRMAKRAEQAAKA